MQREGFYERDWYGSTFLHPVGAVSIILLGGLTLALPRKYAIVPLLLLTNFVPCTQRIAIAGADFNLLRIMVIFGWARMFFRGEYKDFKVVKLDKLLLAWAISETFFYVVQQRTPGALITMIGRMMEAVGGYFMVRCFVKNWGDILIVAKALALIAIPVGILFIIEKQTGRNFFSFFGGVPEYTIVRDGKLRAMGAITNPILAGCVWASFTPVIGALFWERGWKLFAVVGVVFSVFVVYACASSTPLAALMASCLGCYMFKYRHYMAEIRKGVLQTLLVLHILKMTRGKPVWHLLSRIDLVGGSTGWHRYHLIDAWIHRFLEWAPWGVKHTGHWGWGLWDVTNQYVLESVRGGLVTLIFFVWMIVTVFKYVGPLWRSVEHEPAKVAMAWALGSQLFIHCCAFIAVSYFGQMVIVWYVSLALVGCAYAHLLEQQEAEEKEGDDDEVATERVYVPDPMRRRGGRRLLGAV